MFCLMQSVGSGKSDLHIIKRIRLNHRTCLIPCLYNLGNCLCNMQILLLDPDAQIMGDFARKSVLYFTIIKLRLSLRCS